MCAIVCPFVCLHVCVCVCVDVSELGVYVCYLYTYIVYIRLSLPLICAGRCFALATAP